jgi:hypothetical protein
MVCMTPLLTMHIVGVHLGVITVIRRIHSRATARVVWVDHDSGADDAMWRAVDILWIGWGFLKSERSKERKGQIFHVILIAAAMLAQNPALRTFVQGRSSSERERGSDSAQVVCEDGTGSRVSTDSSVSHYLRSN